MYRMIEGLSVDLISSFWFCCSVAERSVGMGYTLLRQHSIKLRNRSKLNVNHAWIGEKTYLTASHPDSASKPRSSSLRMTCLRIRFRIGFKLSAKYRETHDRLITVS